jgi:acyl-CoA synthetase (AMP-forming)/AMP-acid ligase II
MTPAWLGGMAERGEAAALVEENAAVSYAALADRIGSMMSSLRADGLGAGDAVALHGDYSSDGISAFFALAALGAVVAPVTSLTPATIETLQTACGVRLLYRAGAAPARTPWPGDVQHPLVASLRERRAAGLILLSSGSTGKPKAILHDLDALLDLRRNSRANRRLRILLLLMFDHIGGINTLISTLFSGGTAIIASERSPEAVCRLIEAHRVQVLPGNPTFLNLMLIGRFEERFDLSSLRLITYGTEPMPEQLLRRLRAAFPRVRFLQTFGTTETGIAGTQSASSESTHFKFNDGDYQHRVVDGELQLRSKTQFLGYLNAADAVLTEDGWFRTGDMVELGPDGYLKILGRAKEVINVGGEKVLPLDLESLLLEHPLVADCVVYGLANAITGQAVCADVRPSRPIDRTELRRELYAFLNGKVARFKMPAQIRLVSEIETSERFKKRRVRT